MKKVLLLVLLCALPLSVNAIDSKEFANPQQQETYDSLTAELRCLVCQNQTIADSNAELAADLRRQVFEMLQQGQTREQIVQFMIDRYGDFVLYKPRFTAKTGLLWLGPLLMLLAGLCAVAIMVRRKKAAPAVEDNAEKLAKIRNLLDQGDVS